ncbi:SH3 domain-containing protein [Loktanella salsilacus]|uniref:SH3 domain-containing protein n=1 Tax=Loktanella salsilacus TaxID=195913 RepID=UPI003704BFE2
MGKFIVGTFAILAWAFYVMSGGASYAPETQATAAPEPQAISVEQAEPITIAAPETVAIPVQPPAPTAQTDTVIAEPASLQTAPAFDGSSVGVTSIEPAFTSLSAPAPAAVASPDIAPLREVAGRAVNMRAGPDTSFDVLDTLPRGTQTEVVESDGNGWVRVRVVGTGQMGWMAERLLTGG